MDRGEHIRTAPVTTGNVVSRPHRDYLKGRAQEAPRESFPLGIPLEEYFRPDSRHQVKGLNERTLKFVP